MTYFIFKKYERNCGGKKRFFRWKSQDGVVCGVGVESSAPATGKFNCTTAPLRFEDEVLPGSSVSGFAAAGGKSQARLCRLQQPWGPEDGRGGPGAAQPGPARRIHPESQQALRHLTRSCNGEGKHTAHASKRLLMHEMTKCTAFRREVRYSTNSPLMSWKPNATSPAGNHGNNVKSGQ